MYELEINGRKLRYKILSDCSEYDSWEWTEFYKTVLVEEKKWSWRKFRFIKTGKLREKDKVIFTLNFSVHDPDYTKKYVRQKIEHKLELLGRKEEIKRGEII